MSRNLRMAEEGNEIVGKNFTESAVKSTHVSLAHAAMPSMTTVVRMSTAPPRLLCQQFGCEVKVVSFCSHQRHDTEASFSRPFLLYELSFLKVTQRFREDISHQQTGMHCLHMHTHEQAECDLSGVVEMRELHASPSLVHWSVFCLRVGFALRTVRRLGRAAHQPTRKPCQCHVFLCNYFRLSVEIP